MASILNWPCCEKGKIMSFFGKLWKEGWFNPDLDIDLDFEDIDIQRLKKDGSVVVQKHDRVYKISIPKDKSPDELEDRDVSIEELPGVAAKSVAMSPEACKAMRFKNEFDCTIVEANDWEVFRDALQKLEGIEGLNK